MTVLDLLFKHLPSKYVDAVINNVDFKDTLNDEATTIEIELMTLFDWESSYEGSDFWNEVLQAITDKKKLPELPIRVMWKPNEYVFSNDHHYVMNVENTQFHIRYPFNMKKFQDSKQKSKERFYSWVN